MISGTGTLDPSVELLVGGVAPVVVERRLRSIEDVGGERGDIRVVRACLNQ